MPIVPNISIPPITVAAAKINPLFVRGALKLAIVPSNAADTALIQEQHPPPGTSLDIGGTVTAIAAGWIVYMEEESEESSAA